MFGDVKAGRALLVLASCLFLKTGLLSAQLSVDELEVFLRSDDAARRTGVIRVTNDTDKTLQALVEIQDWDRDAAGGNQFHPLGTVARSCRDQLKAFPLSLRIEPKRTEPLRIAFEGPADASCWGIVFIQSSEPQRSSTEQSEITYIIRTGIKVYVEPVRAARLGDVDSVRLVTGDTASTVDVYFRNAGNAHLKPRGVVEIRSANNETVANLEIKEFPIVPDGIRRLSLPMPKLAAGRYIALALIDYQGEEIAAGQLEFEIR